MQFEAVPSDRGVVRVAVAVVAILAVLAWLLVGGLVDAAVEARHSQEGMLGAAVALFMPFALVLAFGLTAAVGFLHRAFWGGRVSLVLAIVAATAALVAPFVWWGVVFH